MTSEGGWLRLVARAARRRWAAVLLIMASTAATAAALVALLPKTWHAEAVLLAGPDPVIGALGNPARQSAADPPVQTLRELILSRANLVEAARRTDLLARWDATRAPLGRLADAFRAQAGDERFEALVDVLEARSYVTATPDAVRIGVAWPDGPSARDVVQALQDLFLEQRQAREAAAIGDAISILDKHAASARADVDAALTAVAAQSFRSLRSAAPGSQDPDTRRVALMLAARRRAIENIEEQRRVRVEELQSRIAERRAALSGAHPEVIALGDAVGSLLHDSPELVMLREEEAALAREYQRRAGRAPPALAPGPAEARSGDDATTDYARARLRNAMTRHEALIARIDAARLELDVARAAFKYRYAVVRPAQVPRRPVRPDLLAVALGSVLIGLALGVAGATVAELRQTNAPARAAAIAGAISAAVLFASGSVGAALGVPAVIAAGWAVFRAPLRWTLAALMFLMMALPGPGDASGRFDPPWARAGTLLQVNLNKSLPIEALHFTGVDVVLAALVMVAAWRCVSRSPIDAPHAPLPRGFAAVAIGSLGAVLLSSAWGVAQGGAQFDQILWQVHQLALIPIVALIAALALRGPRDDALLGKVVLAAALAKAAQAIWVRYGLGFDADACPTATTHADSILFAVAFCMLLARLMEERSGRALLWCALALPPLALAMHANNRRLVYVEVIAVALLVYLLAPRTGFKLLLARAAIVLAPLAALYVAVGLSGRTDGIFAPVERVRTIIDSSKSRSTAERDIENYNLVANAVRHPLIGLGFGREYTSFTYSDDISGIFPQWKYLPHNSVLGLLAFGGALGFFGYWAILVAAVYFAARAYRRARAPPERIAALTCIGAVLIYLLQCYGDMGFVAWNSVFLLGPAAAIAARLSA